jgi:molybdopterin biosynthesis enzyme
MAPADVPPFARAAMDGYALRASDTSNASGDTPVRLRRIEQIYTGQMPVQTVARRPVQRGGHRRPDA